ncbi:MAG: hypothetical protein R3B45_05380 [Bdellovibrionota bacterium]
MKVLFRTLLVFIAASAFFLLPTQSHANSLNPQKEVLSSWLLTSKDKNQLDAIAKDFEIVSKTGNNFEIYVPHAKEQQFKKLAPRAVLKRARIFQEN